MPHTRSSTLLLVLAVSSVLAACPPAPETRSVDRVPVTEQTPPVQLDGAADSAAPPAPSRGEAPATERAADAPAGRLARSVHRSARRLAALGAVHTVQAARRRVAVATVAGSIPASYPLPGGKLDDKAIKAAKRKRRRIPLGELHMRFPKASRSAKVRLFDDNGAMRPEAYVQLTELLTDPHQGEGHEDPYLAYDPRLFTILYYINQHFDRPIEVISAYRVTQRTRASSNHTKGRAIDFVVDKVRRRALLAYVERSFTKVGVGWYPRSTFIHVDTRDSSYYWVDRSKPGQRQRVRKRKIGRKPRPGSDPTANTIHLPLNKLYRRR